MAELIGYAIALFIAYGIPVIIQSKKDTKKREDMYKNI